MKTFVPLHDTLLINPDKPEELSHGGIVIPDIAKETPVWGTVLAFGEGTKHGLVTWDRVLVPKHLGTHLTFGKLDAILIEESKVLAVEEK